MGSRKLTAADIELAVMRWLRYRKHMSETVPNVSYGLDLHECDVLALSRSRYATEVEIKTSRADLKKDGEKRHGHRSDKIKYLYFAMPAHLLRYQEFVPDRAGILTVTEEGRVFEARRPRQNTGARAFTDYEYQKFLYLGTVRLLDLRDAIKNLRDRIQDLREKNAELEERLRVCPQGCVREKQTAQFLPFFAV